MLVVGTAEQTVIQRAALHKAQVRVFGLVAVFEAAAAKSAAFMIARLQSFRSFLIRNHEQDNNSGLDQWSKKTSVG